jgi:hypothetical protein
MRIKIPTLFSFFLFLTFTLFGKSEPGTIYFADGRVEEVQVLVPYAIGGKVPHLHKMQRKIKYIDSAGKKHKVKPGADILEIRFSTTNGTRRMMARPIQQKGPGSQFSRADWLFLQFRQAYDHIELYRYYYPNYFPRNGGLKEWRMVTVYREADQPVAGFRPGIGISRLMKRHFAHCPAMVEEIERNKKSLEMMGGFLSVAPQLASLYYFYEENCLEKD